MAMVLNIRQRIYCILKDIGRSPVVAGGHFTCDEGHDMSLTAAFEMPGLFQLIRPRLVSPVSLGL